MSQKKDRSSVMRQIDENLRRVYRQPPTESEEVPDRFKALLDQLKKREVPDEGE